MADEDAQLEQQAAAFAAQFMEAGAVSSAMPAPAVPLHVAPFPRLQAAQPQAMAAVEARVLELHNNMAVQGKQLTSEVAQLKQTMANTVSKLDFSKWNTAMSQQVADFLEHGLAEVTKDLQLQLDDIRRDIKALATSASSRPSAGVGEAPEGDPQVERLVNKGHQAQNCFEPGA